MYIKKCFSDLVVKYGSIFGKDKIMDKQIIIDGVDISKCKHYDEVFNYCDQSYLGEGGLLKNTKNPKRCECSPNCYYKQLKRKEQECERYAKINEQETKDYVELLKQLAQLKASKEQAEQKLNKIKDKCNETLELMNKDSGTNAYAGGRCTEAGQILQIIDEVE